MAIDWTYALPEDVSNFFGSIGVDAFASHDLRGSDATVDECLIEATDEINLYVLTRYEKEAVRTNRLLKRWCVVLATVYLCERRGNPIPESLLGAYQRIKDALPLLQSDKLRLPDTPLKGMNVPTFSNMKIDRRFPRRQQRVAINSSNLPLERPRDSELTWFDY